MTARERKTDDKIQKLERLVVAQRGKEKLWEVWEEMDKNKFNLEQCFIHLCFELGWLHAREYTRLVSSAFKK